MINDFIKAKGQLKIVLRDKDGNIKDDRHVDNLVVTVGKEFIAARMKDTGIPAEMSHMAVGTDSTTQVVGNTTLGTENGRVALDVAGGTVTANAVEYSANYPAGTATGALTEAGIFNAGASGTMLCRTTFAVVNKGADDTVAITWTVTVN